MILELNSKESQQKARETRRKGKCVCKRHKIPNPIKVINHKCLKCVCGSSNEIHKCHMSDCPLWPFRFGRLPQQEDIVVIEVDQYGKDTGRREYEGYPSEVNRI